MDRLHNLHSDASETAQDLDIQKKQLRDELKDLKMREQRLANDCAELEEENIGLQKQVNICFSCEYDVVAIEYCHLGIWVEVGTSRVRVNET